MNPDRIQAIVEHGFTERQARFLELVMRHSGVCVPRQYAHVAGIAQGAKCNAFFDRLVRRGHAHAIECVHNRARLYLVHSRLLYHAIGEPSSRFRRAVSPRLALERVMLLDAMLSTPVDEWLATPAEKVAALPLTDDMKPPDGFPLGVQADGRIVVLYLAPEPWPDAFRTFLRAHVPLLQSVPQWTLRIVLPRRFGHAHDDYQRAVHEELESPLSAALIADPKRYFECRRDIHTAGDPQADEVFRAGHRRFSSPRFDGLYRRWIKHATRRSTAHRQSPSPRLWRAAPDASNRSSCRTRTVISLPWSASRVRTRTKLRRGLRREPIGGPLPAGTLNPVPQPPGDHTSGRW